MRWPRYLRSPRDRQLLPRASRTLRMERPESQSEQAAGEVFRRGWLRQRTGGHKSFIFAFRGNRSTRGARGHGPGDTVRVRRAATFEEPRHSMIVNLE